MSDLFQDREQIVIDRIRHFEMAALAKHPEGFFVAFSGGKDSIVMLDLIRRAGVKHEAHYHLTTVDPPELVRFIKQEYPDVIIDRPPLTMWQLIVKKGMPPTRVVRYCCQYLKEFGGDGWMTCIGLRWEESRFRAARQMVEACTRHRQATTLFSPIIDWTTEEVWSYIRKHGLKYPALYDEGFRRLGCIGCPMGGRKSMLKEFKRWPTYQRAYIAAFQRAIDRKADDPKYGEPHAKWTDGQAMFDWWIGNIPMVADKCPLFSAEQDTMNSDDLAPDAGRKEE